MSEIQRKFAQTVKELNKGLIERHDEIDLGLVALIAQKHVLFVGPPGTAKSMFLDSLLSWMGGKKFSRLLTKFTDPAEIFGAIDVMGLKESRYRRVTAGKLPEADWGFLDEIFKASSAILNTLLKILNERVYENDDGTDTKVPLKLCVAASNEWPNPENAKELGALFDRFLLRKTVHPIRSAAGLKKLLWERDHTPKLSTTLSPEELAQATKEAKALPWNPEAQEAFWKILKELGKEGINPGDRRKYQSVDVVQAFAWLEGSDKVKPEHLSILKDVLWDDPIEQPDKCAQIIAKIANPTGMLVTQYLTEIETIMDEVNVSDLTSSAKATAKLSEIQKKLELLSGNGRLTSAKEYCREKIRQIRVASISSMA